ncbi:helix-turn-helix domain-containing protein [Micromonospora sp. WMMD1102]|uniref:ArsR/SmtB family transcription factor n=1 Tax=Micromonospora sp. WMMD1102 TaxID=3016105 RepID=UPI002415322B|nr:helix-turn-helix domain-containing protein [Micromonospora sp. WMMD1102]MDG4788267.1 helix-turn-helix domain-containing protein [Micromonospora sp. WMMD1102]
MVVLDSAQIRILAHPLRSRLLVALRSDGPATATGLAETLGTNTGATSYHLRQLADAGLVLEEPDRGSGRQRFWRAAHQFSSWSDADFADDPDARAAADWLTRNAVRLHTSLAERWLDDRHSYPAEWQQATTFSDVLLRLTPAQLRQLNDELWEVVGRYRAAVPPIDRVPAAQPADGAEHVLLYLQSFPVRGPVPLAGGGTGPGEPS